MAERAAGQGRGWVLGRSRGWVLGLTLAFGLLLYFWQLGTTGLVDETPPLFAAAARAMAETGDWLIPRVNGLPRYDKPPLVYWLMGLGYALPGQEQWNPLGTWAARFPSALATVAVMLTLADTVLRWPQKAVRPGVAALTAALAYALSPLVLLWGRIAVSDALFSGLLAISLLLAWRAWVAPGRGWWQPWLVLALAVLTKGPVAVVLFAGTLLLFAWRQGEPQRLWRHLRPLPGLALLLALATPWYGLALWREGRPYWDSFFGYHNFQRFTVVVNHHLQPWWYFLPVLVVASLPATPLLLLGLGRALGPFSIKPTPRLPLPAEGTLELFAACWLVVVFLFFTVAATKLPSYWLPATPAAGLLIALAAQSDCRRAWGLTLLLSLVLGVAFLAAPWWVPLIREPELPTLPAELLAAGRLPLAAGCFLAAVAAGLLVPGRWPSGRLLSLQLPLVLFVVAALLPSWALGDRLRGLPVRRLAAEIVRSSAPQEPVAMVGVLKPSLHYYSRRVVLYEGQRPAALLNLAERLRLESRAGQLPSPVDRQPTLLVVIDQGTADLPHWRDLAPEELARQGIYRLWRLDRRSLERRAERLKALGLRPDWQRPVPERY